MIITAVVTAVVTFILAGKYEKGEEKSEKTESGKNEENNPASDSFPTASGVAYAPVSGKAVKRDDIPDETFASGVLGDGIGILPSEGIVRSPFAGTVSTVADTHHAVGISSPDGMEMLIHVGVDTVDMNGRGFTAKVSEGDAVAAGQELLTFDRKAIAEAGHPDVVVVLLTNAEDFKNVKIVSAGPVNAGGEIIRIL